MRMAVCLTVVFASAAWAEPVYDFEHLTVNQSLVGQDGWVLRPGFADIEVRTGIGFDTSKVAAGNNPARNLSSILARPNDAAFSFPQFQGNETDALVQADVRFENSGIATVLFGPSNDGPDGGDFPGDVVGEFGPRIRMSRSSFSMRHVDMFEPSVLVGSAGSSGDWFRLQLRMDFTALGGEGSGSVFYRNLTRSEVGFTPVPGLQDLNLGLKLNGVDPHVYLKATLQALANGHPASRIDDLLPWNFPTSS